LNLNARQMVYLALAVIGLCVTWYFNLQWMAETGAGVDFIGFFRAGYVNHAATSLTNDLLVGCVTFMVLSFVESHRLRMKHWWVWPVLTFGIAFACAFPLFLFLRDRRIQVVESLRIQR
jgi:hypothetical protein